MNVLLLGATGFIGSNIIGPLGAGGLRVFQYQRPGRDVCLLQGGVALLPHEILFGASPPHMDAIVSVAGCGNPASCEENPAQALRAETELMNLISGLATRVSAASIVHISSAGTVYGEGWDSDPSRRRVFSEDSQCEPLSSYGRIKLAGEQRLLSQCAADRATFILRASNVYGLHYAKQGRQGLINTLAERSLKNEPVTIFGDGEVYRDYLFSDDLAAAIICALNSRADGIFNVARGESHNILQVVDCLESLLGRGITRVSQPARGFDVKYSALSIERARSILSWKPVVDLEAGVAMILGNLGWHRFPAAGIDREGGRLQVPSAPAESSFQPRGSSVSATSQDEISLRDLGEILRRAKWLIVAVPVFCAAVAGGIASMLPKVYEASIVVSPATDSGTNGSMGGLASQLGGLASLAGLSGLGGTGKEESIAVLQSELLTERFVSENNLLPVLFPETSAGSKPATLWRANEKFKKIRRVTGDRRSGLTIMTIVWRDPQQAADWANGLVRATNLHLRDKAIEESEQHIKYLSEQAAKTDMAQVRSSMYSILESEMKNVMQARGTAEYALRVIDPAVAPEKEAGPKLLVWIAAGFVSGLVVALLIAFLMAALRRSELRA